ncbi:uncharacterized protein [Oryza sativa Japonica Group]|jgi:hypothetical protein|uniref:Expressed protein n=2 Tax=Oryza sativa subsp. japonica TaxID=39947 RepID=Q2QYG2_ORYSJ|nr:expressed protein [Oryza sativa Japonica Group]BAH95492.1 Os12g0120900 [Oryza sativa Japonica Group]|eukprot:NP_001176764.1 Os12g0120900 [Oryza sativa Japonica Group]
MVSLLRRHPNPLLAASVPAHLLRRFSALPDVDHPPLPTSTPTPASTCSSILDLQLAVCGEADLARIHSLVATTLSRPDDYPCLHGSRPLFSLAVSCLPRLRRLDLAVSLLCALLDSALASPGLLTRAISLFSGPNNALRAFSDSAPVACSNVSLSALLSALFGAGRVDDVESTLASAESSFAFRRRPRPRLPQRVRRE